MAPDKQKITITLRIKFVMLCKYMRKLHNGNMTHSIPETMIRSYKDLIVWQKSVLLARKVYEITEQFPSKEQFGITSQMQRAAISISSNIAEGRHRGSRKDFVKFLRIAYASANELETQIHIAKLLSHTKIFDYKELDSLLNEILRMLNSMIQKLKARS